VHWARLRIHGAPSRTGRRGRPSCWVIAATLDELTFYDSAECRVRALLDNGETLEGRAILHESGGWGIWLSSKGSWTGVAGW
jgi:hypothetical protein